MIIENNDDPYVVGDRAVTGNSLGTDADNTIAPVSCRRSFEPTCEMYPYVRFWNRQFSSEDCYQSPLRHPNGTIILTEHNLTQLNPQLST